MHSGYGQPPLECMWDAMKRFPRVVILTEDVTNPVANVLYLFSLGRSNWSDHVPKQIADEMRQFISSGNFSVEVRFENLRQTMATLVCGRNVAVSKSTLSLIVTSSLNARNLFLLGDCARYPNITNARRHIWMWKPLGVYSPYENWENNANQRLEMLTHSSGARFVLCDQKFNNQEMGVPSRASEIANRVRDLDLAPV
jgi:hypothetical protein